MASSGLRRCRAIADLHGELALHHESDKHLLAINRRQVSCIVPYSDELYAHRIPLAIRQERLLA